MQTKGGELKVHVDYRHKADGADDTSIKFDSRIEEIVEFIPSSPELGYQPDVDTVVSRYPDGNWDWEDWQDASAPASDGLTQYDFSSATTDGVFSVRAKISDGMVGDLNPNSMKIDFGLESFPYAGTGTSLCFVGRIHADIKIKSEDDDGKKKGTVHLDLQSEEVTGLWSWVDTVTADDETVPVVASLVADGGDGKNQDAYYTISTTEPMTSMLWDPAAGVDYSSDDSSTALVVGVVILVAALVAGAGFACRKKKAKDGGSSG